MVGDLTGLRFGMLVVTRLLGKTKYSDKIWECICDCGNITKVTQGHLRSGHTRSCGCQKNKLENLVGKTFGYLTVISRDEDYLTPSSGKRYTQWLCQCVCGNTTVVLSGNLKSGSTISCGCKNPHKLENLEGSVFGDLKVLKLVSPYVNPSGRKLIRYECECTCGNKILALANALRSGDVKSCGCKINSKGERFVRSYLDALGCDYDLHKSFSDCLSDKGFRLNFDFYVRDYNLLIECNGRQHYMPVDFFGGFSRYIEQKNHDKIKKEYALDHGFNYIVLDCRRENLDNIIIELDNFFSIHLIC